MIVQKNVHTHRFTKPATQKILVSSGRMTAIDILKLRVCKCGKTETYDLERTIK